MPFTTIATALREPLSTVHAIYNEPSTPRHGGFRNRLRYDTPARRRLVNFIESHNWARTATYTKLSAETGLYISDSTIGQLLKKEGFQRCVTHPKPWLTQRQHQERLVFAHQVSSWTIEDWFKIIWTDESAIHRGGHQRVFVTQRPHKRFHPHCLRPRLRNTPHTMIWAYFTGVKKGPLVF
jgi:Transposase